MNGEIKSNLLEFFFFFFFEQSKSVNTIYHAYHTYGPHRLLDEQ
jgi:hypothetical protein